MKFIQMPYDTMLAFLSDTIYIFNIWYNTLMNSTIQKHNDECYYTFVNTFLSISNRHNSTPKVKCVRTL
jgi:hypothetical protein